MSHGHPGPLRAGLITPLSLVLVFLSAVAFYFIGVRLIHGLGAVTNINPGYPWGIWVVFDVVIGTAFGCGGFAMALLIYVLNRGALHPLMRPALLGGLFGYTLAGFAVMFDLGRWWQVYNMFLPWHMNFTSVMLEIGLCVAAYVTVLWLEFWPAIFERLGWTRLRDLMGRIMWLLIALGVVLPSMHQSSLGTALIPLGHKLSDLYQTAWLPLLFVVSALAMGYAVVVFEATLVTRSFGLPDEHALLVRVGRVVGWIVLAWLAFRFAELAWRGALGAAFGGHRVVPWFWAETLLALAAAGLFLSPAAQASARATFLGAVALLAFGSLYRVDAYLVGYTPAVEGYRYFPSVPELMVTIGIVAFEILLYLVFIKIFPVLSLPATARPQRG
ncbi:MAG: Ni/Fe-hydrogenase cytochrome b subunit [Roseovarius sp.]